MPLTEEQSKWVVDLLVDCSSQTLQPRDPNTTTAEIE
jgi:hypothetical protein